MRRELQCATWGYPTENAYYRDASSVDSLLAIRVPFFAIHAEDDPVSLNSLVSAFHSSTGLIPHPLDIRQRSGSISGIREDAIRGAVHNRLGWPPQLV